MPLVSSCPNVSFLASHNGTNMRAIVAAIRGDILSAAPRALISNNAGSGAIAWAQSNGLSSYHVSATSEGSETAADTAIVGILRQYRGIGWVYA